MAEKQGKVFTIGDNVSIQLCSEFVFTSTDADKTTSSQSSGGGKRGRKSRKTGGLQELQLSFPTSEYHLAVGITDTYFFRNQLYMKQYAVKV